MSLTYEPASEPLHIYVKKTWRCSSAQSVGEGERETATERDKEIQRERKRKDRKRQSDRKIKDSKPGAAAARSLRAPAPVPLSLASLELSDTKFYEPEIRARLGTAAHFCEVVVLKLRTWRCSSAQSARTSSLAVPRQSTCLGVCGFGFRS